MAPDSHEADLQLKMRLESDATYGFTAVVSLGGREALK